MATTQGRGTQQATTKRAQSHGSGLMKAVQPSAELAAIVGHTPLPRTEITKRLWDYIKGTIRLKARIVFTLKGVLMLW